MEKVIFSYDITGKIIDVIMNMYKSCVMDSGIVRFLHHM